MGGSVVRVLAAAGILRNYGIEIHSTPSPPNIADPRDRTSVHGWLNLGYI